MIQVYCNGEEGINYWLKKNKNIEVIDIKYALNDEGEGIMVIYKVLEVDGNE